MSVSRVQIENAQLLFLNFNGEPSKYNKSGKRTFCVVLDPETADAMIADGWNVKHLKPRDPEDEPRAYVQVEAAFGNFPPNVVLINSSGRVQLNEDTIGCLDWMDIKTCDVVLNPYEWSVDGKTGVKAYLKSLYVVMEEDEFAAKYANVPAAGSAGTHADDEPPF